MEYLERLCVFMLIAETMLKLCPSSKYESYMKMLTGLLSLAMILLPVMSFFQADENGIMPKLETFEKELFEAFEQGEKQMEEEFQWQMEEEYNEEITDIFE